MPPGLKGAHAARDCAPLGGMCEGAQLWIIVKLVYTWDPRDQPSLQSGALQPLGRHLSLCVVPVSVRADNCGWKHGRRCMCNACPCMSTNFANSLPSFSAFPLWNVHSKSRLKEEGCIKCDPCFAMNGLSLLG